MKALPSIAFNEFKGSAGDVTARVSKGRQVLSARSMHSSSKTPAQAVSRNRLAKISRSYKKLSDEQMKAWAVLAEKMKGISTFGQAAELTPHNAFVRINSNRAMVGMPTLEDAPVYKADVPEVIYDDLWISPDMIVFTGLEVPSDTYRLVVKMSPAQSPGTSSGWSKTVIVAPGIVDDWGDADITKLYTETIGVAPQEGLKYYLECWCHERDEAEDHQRERDVQCKHGAKHAEDDQRILGEGHENVGEHVGDGVGVVGDPGDQLAYGEVVQLFMAELFHMCEHVQTDG